MNRANSKKYSTLKAFTRVMLVFFMFTNTAYSAAPVITLSQATVWDGSNFVSTNNVQANTNVYFQSSAMDTDGTLGYDVYSSKTKIKQAWNFNDSAPDTFSAFNANPLRVYNSEGSFNPSVTFYDNDGESSSASFPLTVAGTNQAPTATIEVNGSSLPNPTVGVNNPVSFNVIANDSDGTIGYPIFYNQGYVEVVDQIWDFGDGSSIGLTKFEQSPTHTFTSLGNYEVTVIVYDNSGIATRESINLSVINSFCGDGTIDPGETCDDGVQNGTPNHCALDCQGFTAAICGNSFMEAGEECDDGNADNTDACLDTCVAATCGDGFIETTNEFCDDGLLNGQANQCAFDCQSILLPPVLDPIGNQTADVGSYLTINLTATDPNALPLTYSVSPLPLPSGAELDASTGVFKYRPVLEQNGQNINLTFSVDNGDVSDEETITISVNPVFPGDSTRFSGFIYDANEAELGFIVPMVNTKISFLDNPTNFVMTDANGAFTLDNVTPGKQVLDVDTSGVTSPAIEYAGFREEITLIEGANNTLSHPIWMPQIDQAGKATVNPSQETIVENVALGYRMVIPPNTAKIGCPDACQNFTGEISISRVPKGFGPGEMPKEIVPSVLVTFQPVGVSYSTPVVVTYPNYENLEPGELTDFWSLDAGVGLFVVAGKGEVSQDGTEVTIVQGGIRNNDWGTPSPPPPILEKDPNDPKKKNRQCKNKTKKCSGSTTSMSDGALSVTHDLPSYRVREQDKLLRLVYNSATAFPHEVFSKAAVYRQGSTPETISTTLNVAGLEDGKEIFTTLSGIIISSNSAAILRLSHPFNASELETGLYEFDFTISNNWLSGAKIKKTVRGEKSFIERSVLEEADLPFPILNRKDSYFGSGWSLHGLSQIHEDELGNVLLAEGDGSVLVYEKSAPGTGEFEDHDPANSEFPFTGVDSRVTQMHYLDFNNDGLKDLITMSNTDIGTFIGTADLEFENVSRELISPISYNGNNVRVDSNSVVADFNGDGNLDIIYTGYDSSVGRSVVPVYLGNAIGEFTFHNKYGDIFPDHVKNWTSIGAADFDNDGNLDLAVTTYDSTVLDLDANQLYIFFGDGTGDFSNLSSPITTSFQPRYLKVADFNGDGISDIATGGSYFSHISGSSNLVIHYGDGGGTFSEIDYGIHDVGNLNTSIIELADVNNDGLSDIVLNVGSSIYIIPGESALIFDVENKFRVSTINLAASDSGFYVVDANGDGNLDIVAGNVEIDVSLGDGTGINWSAPIESSEQSPSSGTPRNLYFDHLNDDNLIDILAKEKGQFVSFYNYYYGVQGPNTGFISPDGDYSTLTKNIDDTFTRRDKFGNETHFNPEGYQTSITDTNGNTMSFAYDAQNRIDTMTDEVGKVTNFVYSGDQLTSITDPFGRVTNLTHDGDGNLTRITDPDTTYREFSYDPNHLMLTQNDKRGGLTTYEYNDYGMNLKATRADLSTREIFPMIANQVPLDGSDLGSEANPFMFQHLSSAYATFTDGEGNDTRYRFNPWGGSADFIRPIGGTTSEYNDQGEVTREIRPNSTSNNDFSGVQFNYDGNGNMTRKQSCRFSTATQTRVELCSNLFTASYDADNSNLTSFKPYGRHTAESTFEYDLNGNLIKIIDPLGVQTINEYTDVNCPGMVTKTTAAATLPEEAITLFEYFPDTCNLKKITDPLLNETNLTYDSYGNVQTVLDAEGNTSTFNYDNMNRIVKTINANLMEVEFLYDDAGNLTKVIDERDKETMFEYDSMNRVEKRTDPLGKFELYEYDNNGNLVAVTNRRNQRSTFEYDAIDRLIQKNILAKPPAIYNYTKNSTLTSANNENREISFAHNGEFGDLRLENYSTASFDQPQMAVINNNTSGLSHSLADSLGASAINPDRWTYHYTDRLQIESIDLPHETETIDFTYDNLGRQLTRRYPKGTGITATYDAASRLTSLVHDKTSTPFSSFSYGYDKVGNRTSLTTARTGLPVVANQTFGYDDIYQLTSATHPLSGSPAQTFDYDDIGNLLQDENSASNAVYDDANRLIENDTHTFTYDDDGNMRIKEDKVSGIQDSFTWDAEGYLQSVSVGNGPLVSFKYDALGRRVEKMVSGGDITRWVYFGPNIHAEYDGNNVLKARYFHIPGTVDQPLMMERDNNGNGTFEDNERYFYHTDALGSVTEITDNIGNVDKAYVYDAYGKIVHETGTLKNPYAFTGREYDPETGLYYYRARYYDPDIKRFISEDPIGFAGLDTNFYRYVNNNPLNYVDPSGNITLLIGIGGVVLVGGVVLTLAFGAVAAGTVAALHSPLLPIAIIGGIIYHREILGEILGEIRDKALTIPEIDKSSEYPPISEPGFNCNPALQSCSREPTPPTTRCGK